MKAARLLAALLASIAPLAAAPAHAQSDPQTIAELKAQVEALTNRVNELEQSRGAGPRAPAAAQTSAAAAAPPLSPAATPGTKSGAMASDVVSASIPAAPIERPLQKPGSSAQLSASSDGGEVAIRLGTTIHDAILDASGSGAESTDTLSLTGSAPVAKGDDRSDIGTLDAFTNSSVLKLSWSRFLLPFRLPRRSSDPSIRARYAQIVATAVSKCVAEATGEQAAQACRDAEINDDFIADHDPREAGAFDRLYHPKADLAFGLEGSLGYRKLSFFDAASLEKKSITRVPLGAKGFVTMFPDASLTSVTASFAYQRDWEDQDPGILCPAPASSSPVSCISGPIGSPNRKTKLLGALEFRKQFVFSDFFIPSIGVAPQFTYDFNGKEAGIDVPIYLVPDDKGNLLGGVRFGYTTGKKDFVIGVFVGTAFSFDPR